MKDTRHGKPDEQLGCQVCTPSRAPESMDVVLPPRIETDLALDALCDAVEHARARAFLRAYRITRLKSRAAEAASVTLQSHRRWLGSYGFQPVQGYREAFEAIDAEVDVYWEELAEARALHGSEEVDRDGKGEVTRRRNRHDSGYLKMVLAGRMPDKYGNGQNRASAINIIITRTDE